MKLNMLWISLWVVIVASSASAASLLTPNGGFEGTTVFPPLPGWMSAGSVTVLGPIAGRLPNATEGTQHVLLTTTQLDGNPSVSVDSFQVVHSSAITNLATVNNVLHAGDIATTGSVLSRIVTGGHAGDRLLFDWDFLTNATDIALDPTFNDFAFVLLTDVPAMGSPTLLASQVLGAIAPPASSTILQPAFVPALNLLKGFSHHTGYKFSASIVLPMSGDVRLIFGVVNAGPSGNSENATGNSGLLLDNVRLETAAAPVPEPGAFVLLGSGLLALVWYCRRCVSQ